MHGSNLVVDPSHSLQRGVVVAQLKLTTRHVLLLEDGHARLPVVLWEEERTRRLVRILGRRRFWDCYTYSAADGPEGDHPLDAVGVAAAVGLDAGVVALLQDELLPTEAGVLVAHPAAADRKDGQEARQEKRKSQRRNWVTYAPHSTFRERMFSIPHSMMFWQLAVNSMRLPWKCSWSYTVICKTAQSVRERLTARRRRSRRPLPAHEESPASAALPSKVPWA